MSLVDRVLEAFQFLALVTPKAQRLEGELAGLDRDVRELEMRVVRLETIVELVRGERLPPLPRLADTSSGRD
jgi:hypothetical protein